MRGKRLELKEPGGWFAAGEAFQRALGVLSDGAFKLFAYLCLEADRESGCFQSTQSELAQVLGKSRRALGTYLHELEAQGICQVRNGKNQYAATTVQIREAYWPYRRPAAEAPLPESAESPSYVESVRRLFLALGCSAGRFSASDVQQAKELQQKGVPLSVVEDALLLGACRKYLSWLEGHSPEPIGSLRYFQALRKSSGSLFLPAIATIWRPNFESSPGCGKNWRNPAVGSTRAQNLVGLVGQKSNRQNDEKQK